MTENTYVFWFLDLDEKNPRTVKFITKGYTKYDVLGFLKNRTSGMKFLKSQCLGKCVICVF